MDIELYTTKELIDEIMKRKTFCGLIVKSSKQDLMKSQIHDNFEVFTTLNEEQTVELLGQVKEGISCE